MRVIEKTIYRFDELTDDANRIASDWIYRALEKEYDYQMSDETIRANEYEFDENGVRA